MTPIKLFVCAAITSFKYKQCSIRPLLFNYQKYCISNKMSLENNSNIKKSKSEPPKIGTHNGLFHCDEVLACFMLTQLPKYKNAEIIRTRDNDILKDCDIVVDVGGVFDRETNRYDHHQKTFNETFSSLRPDLKNCWDIRLSSAGLIYTYFGEEVIRNILKEKKQFEIEDDVLKIVYQKVYEYFIREIDGIDNGVPMYDGEPRYRISSHISNRVGRLNPDWRSDDEAQNGNNFFSLAMDLVGGEFEDEIFNNIYVWWPAHAIVKDAINERFNVYSTGEILELKTSCPWKQHLFELENELNISGIPKYVLYKNKENDWRVICVPNHPSSFVCRKFLHKDWRGLRDNALQNITGINDAMFCHVTGFIGGSSTREGALSMAIKSLNGDYEN